MSQRRQMRRGSMGVQSFAGAVMLALLAAGAARAQPQTNSSWTVRGYLSGVAATENDLSGQLGFGLDLEYRPLPLLGVDLSFAELRTIQTTTDFPVPPTLPSTVRFNIRMMPVMVGVYVHPNLGVPFDWYLGPTVGATFFGGDDNGEFTNPSHAMALGAVLGFDVPLAAGWGVGANARYAHITGSFTIPVDWFQLSGGVSYTW